MGSDHCLKPIFPTVSYLEAEEGYLATISVRFFLPTFTIDKAKFHADHERTVRDL